MKKFFYYLVFLIIGNYCFSQNLQNLPSKPWEDIVEMNYSQNGPLKKWETDIKVKLEGNYTQKDSISVATILKKLSALTETISITFSKLEKPNFIIKFSDTILYEKTGSHNVLNNRLNFDRDNGFTSGEIYVYKAAKTYDEIYKYLESQMVLSVVGGRFAYPLIGEKRNSIFNPILANIPLNDEDEAIIKELYKIDFEVKLAKAELQFKDNILKKIQKNKISTRDRSLWWVKNPIAILFLPALILVLLALFFINRINKSIVIKIKKDRLRFGIIALITLLFADVLIVLCVSFYDFLTIPDDCQNVSIIRKDTVLTTTVLSLILFPFLYLFRFMELKIQKTTMSIFTKTILIFFSTGILPFVCVLIVFFIEKNDANNYQTGFFVLSQIFLYLMTIASVRSLIGYFIFKERNLIVENENKLANLRELKAKAELKSLQAQINPHFLYNSLNSIASLALVDAQKTQKMAYSLSDLFKYSINRKDKKTSTVHDEVSMVKTYLDIEKIRFGDRLQFTVEVDENLENYEIPLFLIQPLVENAVKHGISKNEGVGNIGIKISKEQNEITISVSDNGPDFPEGLLSGHGLQTVFDLLRLTYGDKASLNWTNTPEKMIIITIPETI